MTTLYSGTMQVPERHQFDVGVLQAYLGSHIPDFAGPLTVELFKGGQSNPTYKLITPKRTYAMRAKPGPVAKLLPVVGEPGPGLAVLPRRVVPLLDCALVHVAAVALQEELHPLATTESTD